MKEMASTMNFSATQRGSQDENISFGIYQAVHTTCFEKPR